MIAKISKTIDHLTECFGQAAAWLALVMMLVVCTVVLLRYFLETGSLALQELATYLHASVFMLGAAFTLKRGSHVRVDIFYRRWSIRSQAMVNLIGSFIFLLPVSGLLFVLCWNYVLDSWAIREVSSEPGGLPAVYLLKTLMLLMPALLFLQGISQTLKSLMILLHQELNTPAEHLEQVL